MTNNIQTMPTVPPATTPTAAPLGNDDVQANENSNDKPLNFNNLEEAKNLRPDITSEEYADWEQAYNEALAESNDIAVESNQPHPTEPQLDSEPKMYVCSNGATYTEEEIREFERMGYHPTPIRPEDLDESNYGRFYSAEYQGSQVVGTKEQIEEFEKTGVLPAGVHQLPPDPSTLQ